VTVATDTVPPMTTVVLFHHALGLTDGIRAVADRLTALGHTVHVPDLYDGATFTDIGQGVAHAQSLGFPGAVIGRGVAAAADIGPAVYIGVSLGALPAQALAQSRPDVLGCVLIDSAILPSEIANAWPGASATWPAGVPLQLHAAEADEWGDWAIATELAATIPEAECFDYPVAEHLVTDSSLPWYDDVVTSQVLAHAEDLLESVS
jgi:dienelactone hydrolase